MIDDDGIRGIYFLVELFLNIFRNYLTNTAAALLPQPGETIVTIFATCAVFRAFHLTFAALC